MNARIDVVERSPLATAVGLSRLASPVSLRQLVTSVSASRLATAALSFCAFCTLVPSAEAAGVAMVTDLQGKATVASSGRTSDVAILDELEPGTVVQLAQGATLVALYLEVGDEYVFKGAATIEFKPGQPDVQSGAKPERRSLALGKNGKEVRIKPVGMVQGAMVMRSARTEPQIELLNPTRARTLEAKPEFRWSEPQPGLKYDFEVDDDAGATVFETQVVAATVKLPPTVTLREGASYIWRVSTRLLDGKLVFKSGAFTIATADVRTRATALRPATSAPLSARVAYAAWLDEMDLKDEARKVWKAASAERPESQRLSAQAAQ